DGSIASTGGVSGSSRICPARERTFGSTSTASQLEASVSLGAADRRAPAGASRVATERATALGEEVPAPALCVGVTGGRSAPSAHERSGPLDEASLLGGGNGAACIAGVGFTLDGTGGAATGETPLSGSNRNTTLSVPTVRAY